MMTIPAAQPDRASAIGDAAVPLLYHMPGSCSRVVLVALEEIGLPYGDVVVDFASGQQHDPAFRAINPRGQVPALAIDGTVLTETAAILAFLADRHPAAALLPRSGVAAADMAGVSDLIWCAVDLHRTVHRLFRPARYTTGDPNDVKATAAAQMADFASGLADRLRAGPWWYGATWSILDPYIAWMFAIGMASGLALDAYPAIAEHRARVEQRPTFRRALAREAVAIA